MARQLRLSLGMKTDPVQYRYSYPWLFNLLAEEGVRYVQLGSFFEMYHLPDAYFGRLRAQAEDAGLRIASVFTTHREWGGYFAGDADWERVARRNHERMIEVAALLGADSAGSSAGHVCRDRMDLKAAGTACYLRHMRDLMRHARAQGLEFLTVEPMSCLAEPPTLPEETAAMTAAFVSYHRDDPATVPAGLCFDVSHGYADASGVPRHTPLEPLDAALPHVYECT